MDETHREFVDLLASAAQAPDEVVLATWQTVVTHTEEHFGREDQWMQATRFAPGGCHATEHDVILKVMREGARRGQAGDLPLVRQMARELGTWFTQHAQGMDAVLAEHLRAVGFDEATGLAHSPDVLAQDAALGCGV
jgi:hemerythrin-like metal-binding protein